MDDELIQHDRMSGLEEAVRDVSFKAGKMEGHLETLMVKVDTGFAGLHEAQKAVIADQEALDKRLKPFEEGRAARAKRWEIIKKGVIPAIAAMAGLFGAKFGGVIWDALTKLF